MVHIRGTTGPIFFLWFNKRVTRKYPRSEFYTFLAQFRMPSELRCYLPMFCMCVCAYVRASVRSIEISASRPARDFKFFLFDSSQGLDFIWWAHRGAVGGPKRGFFHTKFKVWLAICQNITKFDGEYDGAHPRNNWTNF